MAKAAQREEKQAEKQALKAQHDEEQRTIAKSLVKTTEKWKYGESKKVTQHDLLKERERRDAALAAMSEEHAAAARREVGEGEYLKTVMVGNRNVDPDDVSASGIDAVVGALDGMGLAPPSPAAPMTFKDFLDREMPGLREEKPGLKLPQYKDIAYKMWTRSPENPANQKK